MRTWCLPSPSADGVHASIHMLSQSKFGNPNLRHRVFVSIEALMVKHFLVHDDRLAVFARIFHETKHEKSAGVSGHVIAPLHIDINPVAVDNRPVLLRLHPSLERSVFQPARLADFIATQMQVLIGKNSCELLDEACDDGHDLWVGGIEGNAPVIVFGNVGGAGSDVAAVAESEPSGVTRNMRILLQKQIVGSWRARTSSSGIILMPKLAAVLTIDLRSEGEYCFARRDGSDSVNSGHDALANANACSGE